MASSIAAGADIAVVARSLLESLADGQSRSRSAVSGPGPGQQLPHAVELTDRKLAPRVALTTLEHRPTSAQRIRHSRRLPAGSSASCPQCSPVPALRRKVMVDEFPQAQVPGYEGNWPRRWSSKRMRIRSGLFCGSKGAPCFRWFPKTIIPDSRSTRYFFNCPQGRPSVDSGLEEGL